MDDWVAKIADAASHMQQMPQQPFKEQSFACSLSMIEAMLRGEVNGTER